MPTTQTIDAKQITDPNQQHEGSPTMQSLQTDETPQNETTSEPLTFAEQHSRHICFVKHHVRVSVSRSLEVLKSMLFDEQPFLSDKEISAASAILIAWSILHAEGGSR